MIRAAVYDESGVTAFDDIDAARRATGTTWVHATGVEPATFDRIADVYGIHPLAVEDHRTSTRPKLEEFNDYTAILVKTASLRRGETSFSEELMTAPVGIFVGDDWVISVSPAEWTAADAVWQAVDRADERILQRGADFTAYRLLDVIVNGYFDLLDDIEDDIEAIEEAVLGTPDRDTLQAINSTRRELLSFRKLAWPMREVTSGLARGDPDQVAPETEKYFRDVSDRMIQLVDLTETYRDLVSGARDIYLNTVSQSTNEVMKALTVVATIFLPLTFVVGVYGMNFSGDATNMPELTWAYAYPAVMLGMLGVAGAMLWYFRRQRYI